MPIIGYDTIGSAGQHGRLDYYDMINWIDQVTMSATSVLGNGYIYGYAAGPAGTVEYRMFVYEIGVSDALSPLVASSTAVQTSAGSFVWITLPFTGSTILENGKTYAVAHTQRTISGGSTPYYKYDGGTATFRLYANSDMNGPADLTPFGAPGDAHRYSAYAEYEALTENDFTDDLEGSFPILVPVEPHPILTDGRYDSPNWMTGHGPENVLDRNMNTYWEPEDYGDDSLYFDLGEDTAVYAVAMWLHNYNESWGSPKSWQVSWSLDDSTYHTLTERVFDVQRDSQAPLVIDICSDTYSARYWKITFKNFDEYPQTHVMRISQIMFVIPKYLRSRRIRPIVDTVNYGTERLEDAIKRIASRSLWWGRTTTMPVRLTLTSQADATKATSLYQLARYGARPIITKPDASDTAWKLLHMNDLSITQPEFGALRTDFTLRDVGHELVERYDQISRFHPETVGSWHFAEDLTDDSDQGNDLTGSGVSSSNYTYGNGAYGKTALTVYDGSEHYGYIAAVDATDFDMGTSDFTVEMIMLITTASANSQLVRKMGGSPKQGWEIRGYKNNGSVVLQVDLGDGTNQVINSSAGTENIADGEWHYIAVVVDRGNDELRMYIDGTQYGGDIDISPITGNISNASALLYLEATNNSYTAFDLVEITKRTFSLAELTVRQAGVVNYGTWRV